PRPKTRDRRPETEDPRPKTRDQRPETKDPRPTGDPRPKTGDDDGVVTIHLIDGTYELFRHYYAVPRARDADGREVGAVRAVVGSFLGLLNRGATHVGVATDHVIESFRNALWRGYKTSAGVERDLLAQFSLLEEALTALGVTVWPMVEFEADDALAAA